jgi:hypothetical protein
MQSRSSDPTRSKVRRRLRGLRRPHLPCLSDRVLRREPGRVLELADHHAGRPGSTGPVRGLAGRRCRRRSAPHGRATKRTSGAGRTGSGPVARSRQRRGREHVAPTWRTRWPTTCHRSRRGCARRGSRTRRRRGARTSIATRRGRSSAARAGGPVGRRSCHRGRTAPAPQSCASAAPVAHGVGDRRTRAERP